MISKHYLEPTADMASPLALAIYMFVSVDCDALATGKGYSIKMRPVLYLCGMQDAYWMPADKPNCLLLWLTKIEPTKEPKIVVHRRNSQFCRLGEHRQLTVVQHVRPTPHRLSQECTGTRQLTTRLKWICVNFNTCICFYMRHGSAGIHVRCFDSDAVAQGNAYNTTSKSVTNKRVY